MGQYKEVHTVGVIDLSDKGGGGRTEREQENQVSSMWKEDQSLGCGTRRTTENLKLPFIAQRNIHVIAR